VSKTRIGDVDAFPFTPSGNVGRSSLREMVICHRSIMQRPAVLSRHENLLGVVDDVRTMPGEFAKVAQNIGNELQTEDGKVILRNIKILRERFEPETVVKRQAAFPLSPGKGMRR